MERSLMERSLMERSLMERSLMERSLVEYGGFDISLSLGGEYQGYGAERELEKILDLRSQTVQLSLLARVQWQN